MVRWLSANWIWLVVVGGMVWMHLGMHRGHGGHGGGHGGHAHGSHGGHSGPGPQRQPTAVGHANHGGLPREDEQVSGHRHRGC